MRFSRLLIALVILGLLVPANVSAGAEGAPDISVFTPENTLTPGENAAVTLHVSNHGNAEKAIFESDHELPTSTQLQLEERTKTAQNTRITLNNPNNAPVEVTTNTIPLGPVHDGEIRQATFNIDVDENAPPGTYDLDATVEYTYDNQIYADGEVASTETVEKDVTVEIEIKEQAKFEIVDVTTNANIGDSGTTELTLKNIGSETASSATVSVQSENPQLSFGGSPAATRYVGGWEPGQTKTVFVDTDVAEYAAQEHYALSTAVSYDNTDGNNVRSQSIATGVTPNAKQSFSISGEQTDLRVGETKTITGTITNDGPAPINNAVVVFATDSRNFHVQEHKYEIGSLQPGETATFEYPVEISKNSDAGERQLSFNLEYDTENDDPRVKQGLKIHSSVSPEQPTFTVETNNSTIEAGQTKLVDVQVTNNADATISNIDAKAYANDPLSLDSDTAFIKSLEPGETKTITFKTTSSASATPTTHSLSVDFQYDTADGDTKLSDSYPVAVEITAPTDSSYLSPTMIGIGAVVLVVLGAGVLGWRRN